MTEFKILKDVLVTTLVKLFKSYIHMHPYGGMDTRVFGLSGPVEDCREDCLHLTESTGLSYSLVSVS